MKDFCVYLTEYSGDKLPSKYIGSTSIKNINKGYCGSIYSKRWKDIFKLEIKENRHLFTVKILSEHSTRIEALDEELRLHKLYDVVKSNDYINQSYARKNGFFGRDVSGELNPMFGVQCSEEAKIKISLKNKGRKDSDKVKLKKSIARLGNKNPQFNKPHTEETKNKISNSKKGKQSWNKGVSCSEETKRKISESKMGKIPWNKGLKLK